MTPIGLRHLFLVLAIASTAGCGCSGNDEAVAKARQLPNARFAKLFQDVAALPDTQGDYRGDRIPAAFADLAPESITIRPDATIIHLSGCVDDKVSLVVRGADGKETPTIELLAGEAEAAQTMWTGGK